MLFRSDSNNSVASDKYGKFNAAARAKEMEASAEDSEQPLLSEKLRQQELISEQQSQNSNNNRRGPIMDSDRYATSNKKKMTSQAPSSGSSMGSLQRMQMEISAAKEGNRNKHQQSERRRKMNLAFSAFGDKHRIIKRVKHVMKCTKKDEDDDHE